MSKPILTIIITAFNEEKYLNRCVDSLINSLGDKIEDVQIIISNNNSTDKTLGIAQVYERKFDNITVITSTKKGPSVARNVAINKATSEFITFIDGDDYVDENIVKIIDLVNQNLDIDLFQFSYFIHKGDNQFAPDVCKENMFNKVLDKKQFLKNFNLNTGFSSSSSRIIKKDLILNNNISYNEDHMQMEDMEFGVKVMSKAEKFMFLDVSYYHYETRHENSLTKKISLDRMLQGINASNESVKYLKNSKKENKKLLQLVSLMTYSLIRRYKELENNEKDVFLSKLKQCKIVLDYPFFFSTKLFYLAYKILGIKFAIKFI